MNDLTPKQKAFFDTLKNSYSQKALPSFEILKNELNFKSKNSISQYIKTLKEKGYIEEIQGNNYINKNKLGAPFLSSKVRAGFASIMDDTIENLISFDEILNLNSPSSFVFKVSGDSMIELGIFEGDLVCIKKQSYAQDGDIVLAEIDGGFTLKTYRNKGLKVFLEPANKNYPNIYPEYTLRIFGVAQGIVRKF